MKEEVLHGLLAARTLFDIARARCFVRDRHVASAGLIVLQDALELVLYTCLLEIGVDEEKAIEQLSFDQLIGELRHRKMPIVKSGTLKAMNKQRVLIKHHAQLAEPEAAQQYYRATIFATDHLLQHVIGKPLQGVVVADAIATAELKHHVAHATTAIEECRYFDSMIETRQALFRAVEFDYDIRDWSDHDPASRLPPPIFSGIKAPYHTRNRDWIQRNVRQPTDYIQLDYERAKAEMLEIGVDPEEFFNVRRLTPAVYYHPDQGWSVTRTPREEAAATEDNTRYCLDVVVSIIRNQESRKAIVRTSPYRRWRARILHDQVLLARAKLDAPTETTLRQGSEYDAVSCVTGLDVTGEFVYLFHLEPPTNMKPPTYFDGYIPREACELEEY